VVAAESQAAAASLTAPQLAQPFPSALQQRPPAYGHASAAGRQATDASGRTNGTSGQTADHAAAATQTLGMNPLFSEDHHAEDGRVQQRSDGAAASPELVELQRAYGNQVSYESAVPWQRVQSVCGDAVSLAMRAWPSHLTPSAILQMAENEDLQEQVEELTRRLQQQESSLSAELQAVQQQCDQQAAALQAARQEQQRQQEAAAEALRATQAELQQATNALDEERHAGAAAAERAAEQETELLQLQGELSAARKQQEADARQAAEAQQELHARLAAIGAEADSKAAGAEELATAVAAHSEAESAAQQAQAALQQAEAQLQEQGQQLDALQQQVTRFAAMCAVLMHVLLAANCVACSRRLEQFQAGKHLLECKSQVAEGGDMRQQLESEREAAAQAATQMQELQQQVPMRLCADTWRTSTLIKPLCPGLTLVSSHVVQLEATEAANLDLDDNNTRLEGTVTQLQARRQLHAGPRSSSKALPG
jgi:hypothetical protein